MKYTLIEGQPRGFMSVYITILTAFRALMMQNQNLSEVAIDRKIFSLYGSLENWFDYARVVDGVVGRPLNVMQTHTKDLWDLEERNVVTDLPFATLNKQTEHIQFNSRILRMFEALPDTSSSLGIHYRGTDHPGYHTIPVSLETFFVCMERMINATGYRQVFVASDDQRGFDAIVNKALKLGVSVQSLPSYRSTTQSAIHFSGLDDQLKIATADHVLSDAMALSRCKRVIGRHSNILNFAWVQNPNMQITYLDGVFKHV